MTMTEKLQSAKALLESCGSPLNAASLYAGMAQIGLLTEIEYLSSTGSGEIKQYKSLTEDAMCYGENVSTMSPVKTDIKLYPSTFPELLLRVCDGISDHARQLASEAPQQS
ncbi:hypothetical protein LH433_02390 [Laribacter hongkongensis]|uniref:hypothetical protein n=1 Tax=Laribacter hongkongensis TaxID=168471 RepID=UPI001EFD01B1|nr:hypothetical protein [Laribacter hongkongensis]MCG9105605.1 hypothetical protein [Laribacter hongkongensis]